MLAEIEKELNAREWSGMNESGPPSQSREDKLPTATALMSRTLSNSQPGCCYCNHPHKSANCETVVQVGLRKQILKRTGRCFVCLRKGHLSREC